MDVKDVLRNRRIELGMTLKQVADAVGVSEGTVSRWESGDIDNMRRERIAALSKVLNLDPLIIIGMDDVGNNRQPNYYFDDATAQAAQELFDNSDLRALLDAARGNTADNLKLATEMLTRMKGTNPNG